MSCATPITRGPNKGKLATGTTAGIQRHRSAGERPCAACAAANYRQVLDWKAANPKRVRDYQRAAQRRWREANPEQSRNNERRWRAANREKANEASRRWAAANREKAQAIFRAWQTANPEKNRERQRRYRARKAAALTIPFTAEQLAQRMAFWGDQCWMCGGPFEEVDHVIAIAAGGPHCLSNLRPACKSCNAAKRDRDYRSVA